MKEFEAMLKGVSKIKEMADFVSKINRLDIHAKRKLSQMVRRLKPENIKTLKVHLQKLSQNKNVVDLYNKYVEQETGKTITPNLKDIANIKIPLNSSWLAWGIWRLDSILPSGDKRGSLEWMTQSGYGPYDTPDVSLETWTAMIESRMHAGSVGWRRNVFNRERNQNLITSNISVRQKRILKYGVGRRK